MDDRLITLAIHTLPAAQRLKADLEAEGIEAVLQNVNLSEPAVAPGVRVRIHEDDLPLALRIIENPDIFAAKESAESNTAPHVILVPVDFSSYSMRACRAAFLLAARHKARVEVVHAFLTPSGFEPQPLSNSLDFDDTARIIDEEIIDADAVKMMDRFAARLRADIKKGSLAAAPFSANVRQGLPEEVINEEAKRLRPMLIVMGTRGTGKKDREVMGSVTAEVLDTCRFPVFTIPENVSEHGFHDLHSVLYFASPDQQDILALDTLHRLLPDHSIDVTIATMPSRRRKADPEALERLRGYCSTHFKGFAFDVRRFTADDAGAVSRLLAEDTHPTDLICVPNRRKNAVARFFNPTLAHRLLFHTDIPMLVIPV